jgi:hypothetical protein
MRNWRYLKRCDLSFRIRNGTVFYPRKLTQACGLGLISEAVCSKIIDELVSSPFSSTTWESPGWVQSLTLSTSSVLLTSRSNCLSVLTGYWQMGTAVLIQALVTSDPSADERRQCWWLGSLRKWYRPLLHAGCTRHCITRCTLCDHLLFSWSRCDWSIALPDNITNSFVVAFFFLLLFNSSLNIYLFYC